MIWMRRRLACGNCLRDARTSSFCFVRSTSKWLQLIQTESIDGCWTLRKGCHEECRGWRPPWRETPALWFPPEVDSPNDYARRYHWVLFHDVGAAAASPAAVAGSFPAAADCQAGGSA